MERLQMDLIDMRSSPNAKDYHFIFHAMCHFTKFHFIMPILRKEAKCVAECLTKHVFPVFGLPRILQMDNGKEFVNKTIVKVVEDWPGNCQIINGRPRHPQSQGLIEQANGTVETMLRVMRSDEGDSFDWPGAIPHIMYSINTTIQHAIKMSPYEAVYGKKPNNESIFGVEDEENVVGRVEGVIQEENVPSDFFSTEASSTEPTSNEASDSQEEPPEKSKSKSDSTVKPTTSNKALDQPTSEDEDAELCELKCSQKKIIQTRSILRDRMHLNANKMKTRLVHNRKKVIDYQKGQFALLYVPKIDRSGTDSIRLPVQIIEVLNLPSKTINKPSI